MIYVKTDKYADRVSPTTSPGIHYTATYLDSNQTGCSYSDLMRVEGQTSLPNVGDLILSANGNLYVIQSLGSGPNIKYLISLGTHFV